MCGFAGFLEPPSERETELAARVTAMAGVLAHRGPDDHGCWTDPSVAYAIGFRRLSIVDLHATGHQPMVSADGRWVMAFNGEIYNHRDLRAELLALGRTFRGSSDTEVLVEAFSEWGADRTIDRLNGMFAIAAWDRRDRRLVLARDAMGEKPLFIARHRGVLRFASEIKALRADGMPVDLRPDSVGTYLRWGFTPGPETMVAGVDQLPPGTTAWFDERGIERGRRRFFDPVELAAIPRSTLDPRALTDELEALLTDAVRLRLEADVPVGAFLSGGIDSSLVCALAQSLGGPPLRTFSIGFEEEALDESMHATAVAQHLGTDHTTMRVTAQNCLDVVPRLASMFDVPFADPSAIAASEVSRLAADHVTVALSGDGGDELFGGYDRYRWGSSIWDRAGRVPRPLRVAAGAALRHAPDRALAVADDRFGVSTDRVRRLGSVIGAPTEVDLYRGLLSLHPEPDSLSLTATSSAPGGRPSAPTGRAALTGLDAFQLEDQLTYLPDDILTKVDRTTMAASLEGRIPLLDPRIVRFAWSLPPGQRVQGDVGKVILRNVLYRHVPRSLVDRPKAGFALPIANWLRGPLREWAEPLISTDRLSSDGVLQPAVVRSLWDEHQRGDRNRQYVLWAVLMLQDWLDAQRVKV